MSVVSPLPRRLLRAGLFLFAASLPISHVPAQIAVGVALIGWVLEGVVNRKWQVRVHPFLWILAFYISWNVVAASLSPRPLHSLAAVADNEWPLLIMLLMFWAVDSPKLIRRLLYTFLGFSSLAMVYAVWQSVAGVELYRGMELDWMGGYYRAVGFYGFYLTFAAFAMMVFFFALAHVFEWNRRRLVFSTLAVVSLLAIVGSFARSIWIAILVGVPLFGFLQNRRVGIGVTAALLVLGLVGVAVEPALRYRLESIIDVHQNETRINLWKTSLRIASARPVFGAGQDNFDHFFPRYAVEGYYDTTVHPHNDYLNVLVAAGVPGLIAFVAMWIVALRVGFRTWRTSRDPTTRTAALGASLSLLGLLIGAVFQNYYGTFINCLGWWMTVGFLFSAFNARAGEVQSDEAKN